MVRTENAFFGLHHNVQKHVHTHSKRTGTMFACAQNGLMRLRCKDCFYVRREGRLYVMCKSFPRHKQTNVVPKEKFTWILTHACQSKLRPY